MRLSSNRSLAQFARACQVHSEGSASAREVFVHGLADRLVELALGLGPGDLLGVLEARPLDVAGGELDAQALADPLGEAGRAVVVGEESLGGVLDLAVDHLEDHVLGGRPSSRLWRNE